MLSIAEVCQILQPQINIDGLIQGGLSANKPSIFFVYPFVPTAYTEQRKNPEAAELICMSPYSGLNNNGIQSHHFQLGFGENPVTMMLYSGCQKNIAQCLIILISLHLFMIV